MVVTPAATTTTPATAAPADAPSPSPSSSSANSAGAAATSNAEGGAATAVTAAIASGAANAGAGGVGCRFDGIVTVSCGDNNNVTAGGTGSSATQVWFRQWLVRAACCVTRDGAWGWRY